MKSPAPTPRTLRRPSAPKVPSKAAPKVVPKVVPKVAPKARQTYAQAGVDINTGDAFVEKIKPFAKKTMRPEVMAGIGGFGALCAIPKGYKEPILVSGTDGIGTKLKFGLQINRLEGLGQDLVAMCVNDVLTLGAEPLLFLDYYACGKLDINQGMRLIQGVAKGCELSGCALIGGETAEMPGVYAGQDFDMAGFAVGVVEKKKILTGDTIKAGDVLIGMPSSGPHANGFSLIRHILAQTPNWEKKKIGVGRHAKSVADLLIEPTRIYAQALRDVRAQVKIKALAHITGGGLIGNVPRVIPQGLKAEVLGGSWRIPPVFYWLQEQGNVADAEMLRVFNLGIGMVAVVSQKRAEMALAAFQSVDAKASIIGEITPRTKSEPDFVLL